MIRRYFKTFEETNNLSKSTYYSRGKFSKKWSEKDSESSP